MRGLRMMPKYILLEGETKYSSRYACLPWAYYSQ